MEYLAIDEALPTKAQILKIVDNFPELQEMCNVLLQSYNPYHNDSHRIFFPSLKIRLTLIQNDVELGLKNLLGFKNNQINAWYLDGFDPRKNKSMWSNSVLQYIKFLSTKDGNLWNIYFGRFC